MKLQHQVCSSEQAFKLKELGVIQKVANYAWQKFPAGSAFHFQYPLIYAEKAHEYAAAFTVSELGLMLGSDRDESQREWNITQNKDGFLTKQFKNEAQLRAVILIYSIYIDLISIEEINKRLEAGI